MIGDSERTPPQLGQVGKGSPSGSKPGSEGDAAPLHTPREGKRVYNKRVGPIARIKASITGMPTRKHVGKHIFAKVDKGRKMSPKYDTVIRFWADCATLPPVKAEMGRSPDWLGVARRCRDELLVLGTSASGPQSSAPSFLVMGEENAKQDPIGGGKVVFRCRSHRSEENFRCRASWRFVVAKKEDGTFSATASAPSCNRHAELETDEYVCHRENKLTRHYASEAMELGEATCSQTKVDAGAQSKGI